MKTGTTTLRIEDNATAALRDAAEAIRGSDPIQQWADAHGLTREQAVKLGVTLTDKGLRIPIPPHKWAKALAR